MTRIISIASGKGGVGKTTVTANLGAALNEFGYKTVVMDTNLTTPNLGFHLGVPLYPKTLHDVLNGDAYIDEAIYVHPTGLKIIPAGISMADLKSTKPNKLGKVVLDLVGDHDVVLLDGAAGLGKESLANIQAADEVLIVTNPQLPSVTDALKAIKVAEEAGTHVLGIVLNRIRSNKSELSMEDVESLLGYPVIASVPDHDVVQESLAAKTPVVHYAPNTKASIELKKLSASLMGMDWEAPAEEKEKQSILSRFFGFLRK
ncbi:MAG: cell division ATPase MinD [Candidatus Aenigmarchaeota archaeon]|nr:cell division ATPase MinD [Candidatus Aenigmarchaeota archaeon]